MTAGQDIFARAILDPAAAVPPGLVAPDGGPAGRRFDVYRNNVAVGLSEALETAFPVLAKLLGEANFLGLAGLFLRAHPPSTPVLMLYGDAMPDFLASLPQVAHLPYLPDIARLEQARRRAYHAADAPVLAAEALAIDTDALLSARLDLHPSATVIASRFPIDQIWRYNMEPGSPKPAPCAEMVLVTRPNFDPVQTVLPTGAGAFLDALALGRIFSDAVDTAESIEVDFDLGTTLAAALTAGAFSSLRT